MKGKSKAKRAAQNKEHSRKDHSPVWDNSEKLTAEQFAARFREAISYYNLNSNSKELKPKIINWMSRNDFSKDTIKKFTATHDWRCGITLGAVVSNLLKGMPTKHKGFNKNRNTVDWVRERIEKILVDGHFDNKNEEGVEDAESPVKIASIQDHIRNQAAQMSEEIDIAVDNFISNPNKFDPKEFKIVNMLRTKGAKAVHARIIKGFYENDYNELLELASGKADEQLREAYIRYPRKNIRKIIEFYELVRNGCDQVAAEAKVLRKPRAKKMKPAEEQVKKLKFKLSDDKLGITSVPAAGIIGAQTAIVYNTKKRKLGLYIAKTSDGLAVKGSKIINYTEKSFQKTLRKPETQLRDLKEQNTQRRAEAWFDKIKATEVKLNGRVNGDVILLKVFK
jgi:hypothetical protein